MRRAADTAEIAEVVAFLASARASYMRTAAPRVWRSGCDNWCSRSNTPTRWGWTRSGSANIIRREFLDSAPAVILYAAAARTQRIRLTSAVTVLSAEDPVRAFQNFATLDLLSPGWLCRLPVITLHRRWTRWFMLSLRTH